MESRKVTELLKRILPLSVVQRLQQGQSMIADAHDEVTLLFAVRRVKPPTPTHPHTHMHHLLLPSALGGFDTAIAPRAQCHPCFSLVGTLTRSFPLYSARVDRAAILSTTSPAPTPLQPIPSQDDGRLAMAWRITTGFGPLIHCSPASPPPQDVAGWLAEQSLSARNTADVVTALNEMYGAFEKLLLQHQVFRWGARGGREE